MIAPTRPKVATTSASHCPGPVRTVCEVCRIGSSNIAWAIRHPAMPPSDLHRDVGHRLAARDLAADCEGERDRRVEVRARDRAEHGDQDDQDRAGRDRVAEQRQRLLVGQPLGHDAGARPPCRRGRRCRWPRPRGGGEGRSASRPAGPSPEGASRRSVRAAAAASGGRARRSAGSRRPRCGPRASGRLRRRLGGVGSRCRSPPRGRARPSAPSPAAPARSGRPPPQHRRRP